MTVHRHVRMMSLVPKGFVLSEAGCIWCNAPIWDEALERPALLLNKDGTATFLFEIRPGGGRP